MSLIDDLTRDAREQTETWKTQMMRQMQGMANALPDAEALALNAMRAERETELSELETRRMINRENRDDLVASEVCALNHTMTRILHLLEDRLGGGQ